MVDLNVITVKNLKKLAKESSIKLKATKKSDIIKEIEAANVQESILNDFVEKHRSSRARGRVSKPKPIRKTIESPTSNTLNDLILFSLLQNLDGISYSKILRFYSSLGIKAEVALRTILRKLKDNDLVFKGNIDSDYEKIINVILNINDLTYPLTLTIREAFNEFHELGFKYPSELIKYFEKLCQKYPEFVSLSSSKIGEPTDLITFKQIFIDKLKFYTLNNWDMK